MRESGDARCRRFHGPTDSNSWSAHALRWTHEECPACNTGRKRACSVCYGAPMKNALHWLIPILLGSACASVSVAPTLVPAELDWEPVLVQPVAGASLRGISTPGAEVIWISGNHGACAVSTDAGQTWRDVAPSQARAQDLDLRSIHAFDNQRAIVASAGPGDASHILRTTDGGHTWQTVHINQAPEGFFDAIAFWDDETGLVMGDPVDGYLTILKTTDGGTTWQRVPKSRMPAPVAGEYAFAASCSSIAIQKPCWAWIGTGGSVARVLRTEDLGHSWTVASAPMRQADEAAGIFAISFSDRNTGIVVGGKYTEPDCNDGNCASTVDGGASWTPAGLGLRGFRSALARLPGIERAWLAVGISGADLTLNDGKTWQAVGAGNELELNAVSVLPSGNAAWGVGPEGRVLKMNLRPMD